MIWAEKCYLEKIKDWPGFDIKETETKKLKHFPELENYKP